MVTAAVKQTFEMLECDAVIRLSRKTAPTLGKNFRRCPYCAGRIAIHFEAWVKQDDGTWTADMAKADCLREPSERSRKYDDWIKQHTYMPYVYWLPLEIALTRWVNGRYRFRVEGDETQEPEIEIATVS
jgi:hypothetical protein